MKEERRIRAKNLLMLTLAGIVNAFGVNRYRVVRMRDIVHDIDPSASITITEIADVFSANN